MLKIEIVLKGWWMKKILGIEDTKIATAKLNKYFI